jgi:hypothetical protein
MIKKSSLKRVAPFAGAFLLAGAAVGCGDDDGGNNNIDAGIDAGAIDGAAADACIGHGCEGVGSPFQLAEGGEFRLERLQLDDGGDFYLASQAFFFKGQEPFSRPVVIPEFIVPIRPELAAQGYICVDRHSGNAFENGASPEAQAIADSRSYYDVGATVSLTNSQNSDDVITLSKTENNIDLSSHIMHDILYRGPDAQDVERNTTYKPAITGSQAYPLLDLKFGESAFQEELADPETGVGDPQLYMPSRFTLTSPTEAEYFDADGMVFTKGVDTTYTYDFEPAPDGWPTIMVFSAFINAAQEVVGVCMHMPTADNPTPDTGTYTLPYEILEVVDEDEPGILLLGRLTHTAWEEQLDKNRIDLIGIECKGAPTWKVQEATGN